MEKTAALKRRIRSRIFSTDHRVIARQYFFLSLGAVLLGTALSLLMRFHLVYPPAQIAGDVMTPEFYLSLLTLHGTIMVFFVLTLAPAQCVRESRAAGTTRRDATWRSRA